MRTRNPIHYKESDEQASLRSTLVIQDDEKSTKEDELKRLIFTDTELNVSQIVDNPKVINFVVKI
jgi:hypothetical protein